MITNLTNKATNQPANQPRNYKYLSYNIIHRTLVSANVPSRLEPSGLERADGKRLDGVTVVPWKRGSTWSGMPPAQTHLPHPTYRVRLAQREQWLLWRRTGRRASTGAWTQPTHSPPLPLNHDHPEPVDH